MANRGYSDPTGDKATGNLERWLKEKRARQALQRQMPSPTPPAPTTTTEARNQKNV